MKRLFIFLLAICCLLQAQAQAKDYITQLNEKYTSGLFRSAQAHFFVPMNEPAALGNITVFQYLQGRVPGLQVYNASVFNPYLLYRFGYPAFFLNEMRVDARTLASIPMSDIAIVKVFTPPFLGGFGGGNGAIAVYTKEGDEEW